MVDFHLTSLRGCPQAWQAAPVAIEWGVDALIRDALQCMYGISLYLYCQFFQGRMDLARNVSAIALVRRTIGNNRHGLRFRIQHKVAQRMRDVYRRVPMGGNGACRETVNVVCNTQVVRSIGQELTSMLMAWLFGAPAESAAGHEAVVVDIQLMAGTCVRLPAEARAFIQVQR